MKVRIWILLLTVFAFACKAKDPTIQLQDDLKNTMQTYLYNAINNDSSNVKYHIKEVVYYTDSSRNVYICEFTVQLKTKLFDTTGIMKAYISKDLKKVDRMY
jgi:hypothetical protein